MKTTKGLFVLAFVTAFALPVFAVGPLVTDRPDFTESALVVGVDDWQFEFGATYDDGANVNATSLGELLVRWGVARKFELRFVTLSYLWVDAPGGDSSGFVDPTIGFKYEFNDGGGSGFLGKTSAAVIAATTVPIGSSAISSPDWQPLVNLALSWDLSSNTSLGTNLGYARPSDGDDRFNSVWASAALGVGLSDSTSVFFELYGFDREEARGPSTATFQTGLTRLLSPDLQLDARIARGLTDDGPDFLVGIGASWRLRSSR
jgi:hypothetical protein